MYIFIIFIIIYILSIYTLCYKYIYVIYIHIIHIFIIISRFVFSRILYFTVENFTKDNFTVVLVQFVNFTVVPAPEIHIKIILKYYSTKKSGTFLFLNNKLLYFIVYLDNTYIHITTVFLNNNYI